MTTSAEIVGEARKWLGTPFRHQGRTRGRACDCVGLLFGIADGLGLPYENVTDYAKVPHPTRMLRAMEAQLDRIAIKDASVGDVLHMAWARFPQHVAVITDVGIIHAWAEIGKVAEHPLDASWRGRVRGAFRFRGLD